jgi:peptidoglycan/LPS O-acetylase OafA/YrhL
MPYRPDIDGLRALAVILVFLFHAKLGPFPGGFIGVDVFFVISGFLITRLIAAEVEATGSFDWSSFYARRARRILPALFFTIGLSAIFAFLLFSPEHLQRFGGSMLTAALSVSNIFFWRESGYFDVDAIHKPLLHTWSLGVEEQFYAFWPLLLVFLLKRSIRLAVLAIAAIGLFSFWLNGWVLGGDGFPAIKTVFPWTKSWMRNPTDGVFFLAPFRVFEFGIGAVMVWIVRVQPERSYILELVLAAGLSMILYAAVSYTDAIAFPYFNALLPCIGTACVIYAGTAPVGGLLLSNRLAVGLGLISYSIYLFHWPLIVFWTHYEFAPLGLPEKFAILGITLIVAGLMYRFVETPFRVRRGRISSWAPREVAAASLTAAFGLAILGSSAWSSDGWTWRLPPSRINSLAAWRALERTYCVRPDPSKPQDLFSCQNHRGALQDIFVWGDSHALHLVAGISETYPDHNVYVLYQAACVAQSGFAEYVRELTDPGRKEACLERNRRALEFFAHYPPSTIVISGAKRADPQTIARSSAVILSELRKVGHEALILGDFIRPGKDLLACVNVPTWLISDSALTSRCTNDVSSMEKEIQYNRELAGLLPSFIDPTDVQCPSGKCSFFLDKVPLFRDDHHLTTQGAILFIQALKPKLPINAEVALRRKSP